MSKRVVVNCGGTRFETTWETLTGSDFVAAESGEYGTGTGTGTGTDFKSLSAGLGSVNLRGTFFAALLASRVAAAASPGARDGAKGALAADSQSDPARGTEKMIEEDEVFLDRNPHLFAIILEFLRTGDLYLGQQDAAAAGTQETARALAREANFFGIELPQLAAFASAGSGAHNVALGSLSTSGVRAMAPRSDGVYWSSLGHYFLHFQRSNWTSDKAADGDDDDGTKRSSTGSYVSEGFDSRTQDVFKWSVREGASLLDVNYDSFDKITYNAGGVRAGRRDMITRKRRKRSLLWDSGILVDEGGDQMSFLANGQILQGVTYAADSGGAAESAGVSQSLVLSDSSPAGLEVSTHERILLIRFPLPPTDPVEGDSTQVAVLFESEHTRSWAVFPCAPATLFEDMACLCVKRFFMTASNLEIVPLGGHLLARMASDARTTPFKRFTISA